MNTTTTPFLSAHDAEIVASLDTLAQQFALRHRAACMARGLPYYFTAGGRSRSEQQMLREKLGTGAAPSGVSKHEIGMAWDANNAASVPMSDTQWATFGEEAEKLGLTWGGRFQSKDLGHVEMPQTRAELAQYRALNVAALALAAGLVTFVAVKTGS